MKSTQWNDERLSVMEAFYIDNAVKSDKTLNWCHENFEENNGKRYCANKSAYEHYLKWRYVGTGILNLFGILDIKRKCEKAGFRLSSLSKEQ